MNPPSCLRVALPVPLPQLFDYLPPSSGPRPLAGVRVRVPFGKRSLVGVVVAADCDSDLPVDRLQRVEEQLADAGLYSDPDRRTEMEDLSRTRAELQSAIDALESQWLEASEALERAAGTPARS